MLNKRVFLLLEIILLFEFISASCNSTQININTASAEELDKIVNVGPVIAGRIIENRTYNSLNDLVRVKGIAEATLAEIKTQGLACVDEEEENEAEETDEEPQETPPEEETLNEGLDNDKNLIDASEQKEIINAEIQETVIQITNLTPIVLTTAMSKSIKSEENKEILKRTLSFYGIITLSVIFGAWFLLNREKNKNEFR
jgi:hypothetical protein